MTREEANISIGTKEWTLGQLFSTSGRLLLENAGSWIIIAAVLYIPVTILVGIWSLNANLADPMDLVNLVLNEGMEALEGLDLSPYVTTLAIEAGGLLVSLCISLVIFCCAVHYADDWLLNSKEEPGTFSILIEGFKAWPRTMVFQLLLILMLVALIALSLLLFGVGFLFIIVIMLVLVFLEPYGRITAVIRRRTGIPAFRISLNMARFSFRPTMTVCVGFFAVTFLVEMLLGLLTSSVAPVPGQEILYLVVSAVENVVSSMTVVFSGLGLTLRYVNQEQITLKNSRKDLTV